ncbi:glycosyltransferase family 2 protein [Clostridium algidicarnis]|uniref:glycosyltransferase family 2 protein n=1 Tax=Clostridium algidicarnis TaxID=37659 RepID=UPI001624D24D|nr:glycosyltransferase family 2 protein [Clostridium algidicarnis]MBB6631499.1 glycosyltransferase family 2 protein [Clostridium algidicarnis]
MEGNNFKDNTLISIVVPCYNEEKALTPFYKELIRNIDNIKYCNFQVIFIDDGSSDKTLEIAMDICNKDKRFKYISFSRNFGKEAAMLAGLKASEGKYTVVMDCDLQDPPSLLKEMIETMDLGWSSVATRRCTRAGEPIIRSFFARKFYKIINKISKVDIVDGARDFRMMSREMVDAIISLNEYNRFTKGIFGWVGFDTKWIEYENIERVDGETKWSFFGLLLYGIEGIVAFTTAPLRLASLIGMITSFISFIYIVYTFIKTLVLGIDVPGYASLISFIMFLGGIQLIALGIIGEYISKTYMEVKKRPHFIIKETNL